MRLRSFPKKTEAGKINLTPMIDVVMVLIIFFLIVGQLASDRLEPVDLPYAQTAALPEPADPVLIHVVRRDGAVRVLSQGVELDTPGLESMLRETMALSPNRPVRVRADRALPYSEVKPVLDACRAAGVAAVSLATEGR